MALYWEWKDKVGEAVFFNTQTNEEYTISLYKGNAFLIFIHEYKEDGKDMYNMFSFFVDEAHAKRMLGLDKDGENAFNTGFNILKKVRINKDKYPYTKKLVDMLIKAFDEITIELYREEGSGNV